MSGVSVEWMKKVMGLRYTNWLLQNNHGDVKYSLRNNVAKEHMCMTHGHGKQCGGCLKEGGGLGKGIKGKKIRTTVIA